MTGEDGMQSNATTVERSARQVTMAPRVTPRILLVEDDAKFAESLLRAMESQGYEVLCAFGGQAALKHLASASFDALVLDIGLPDIDGFEVLAQLSAKRDFGVLVVSGYDLIEDRVRGLDLGADDYLVKPFALPEFEARLRALLRRTCTRRAERIVLADLEVDVPGKRALVRGEPLEMTAREWSVLLALLERVGQVVGKEQLQDALGGEGQTLTENAIEVYVSRLRGRLEDSGVVIRTLRGFGYIIEEPRSGRRR